MGIEPSQSGIWVNRLTTTPLPQHCQITLLKDTCSIHLSIKTANTHRTWPNDVPNVTEWCRRLMSACLTLFIYNSPVVMLSFYDNELNDPVVTESIPCTCFYTDQNQKRRTHVFSVGMWKGRNSFILRLPFKIWWVMFMICIPVDARVE